MTFTEAAELAQTTDDDNRRGEPTQNLIPAQLVDTTPADIDELGWYDSRPEYWR